MNIYFICLFPQELETFFNKGILKKAQDSGNVKLHFIDLRSFAEDKHHKVDDYPFAHKKGMLLKVDVLYRAITSIPNYENAKIIYPSPKGQAFKQSTTDKWKDKDLIFICGYYEGIDERLFEFFDIEEVTLGDFVVTSGELPAMTMADCLIRQLPGTLGNETCIEEESILSGLLEHPQYTQPKTFKGKDVPEILRSGHHGKVKEWESTQSLKTTLYRRPDLLTKAGLTDEQRKVITSFLSK